MKKILDIVEAIEMKITCNNCKNIEYSVGGCFIDDFAEELSKEGWRVTRAYNVLCPKCKRMSRKSK